MVIGIDRWYTLRLPCAMHKFETRFWKYVDKHGPVPSHQPHLGRCWLWTGALDKIQRGHLRFGRADEGQIGTNRASWLIHFGDIPAGKSVLHHCDNPQCVRPSHLYLGTQQDNMRDKQVRGRHHLLGHGELVAGEKNANADLTWAAVRAIREAHAQGVSGSELARRHNVTPGNIYHIVHNRSWRA